MSTKRKTVRVRPKRRVRKKSGETASKRVSDWSFPGRSLPALISLIAIAGLVAVGFVLYTNAAGSGFFDLRSVEIYGVSRAPAEDIEKIVRVNVGRAGVWNTDLQELKQKIEKVPFVKSAAVARRLPAGIVVSISERVPVARVRIGNGDFLVDNDGEILAPAETGDTQFPVLLLGWDPEKSERAAKENSERLKLYQKMLTEWRDYDLATRVKAVDLTSLREPRAVLDDSGFPISIVLGRDNFGRRLSDGIKAIVGKGEIFEAVEFMGPNMRLVERKQKR